MVCDWWHENETNDWRIRCHGVANHLAFFCERGFFISFLTAGKIWSISLSLSIGAEARTKNDNNKPLVIDTGTINKDRTLPWMNILCDSII